MDQPTPSRPRKSLDDRLASLAEQQQQLEARRLTLLAVKKSAARRRDARRKFIIGSAVLAEGERDPAFADALGRILDAQVRKQTDRAAVADLMPGAKPD